MLKLFLLVCFSVNALVDSIPLDDTVIEEHIVGGNDTDISKVPYLVSVYSGSWYWCEGFLISPSHVVTAGSCVHNQPDPVLGVRAGSSSNKEGGVFVKVKIVYRHPQYSMLTADYDVGVIELATPLKFTDKIKAVKLATKEPAAGSEALVSGWGATNENLKPPKTVQSVMVPIYDRTKCANVYKDRVVDISPRMICAGAEGKGAYIGDIGGPLVYKNEVVGIVSLCMECGKKDLPAVYTNIANPEINKFIRESAKL